MATSGISRVSDQMRINTMLTNLRGVSLQSSIVQQQLATGTRLLAPSTDPAAATQVMGFQRVLAISEQVLANLSKVTSIFGQTDKSLGDASDQLLQAKVIASDSINASPEERKSSAALVQSLIDALVGIGNRKVGDTFIFGGTASTTPPFLGELDGVRYVGNDTSRTANLGSVAPTAIGMTGAEVFDIEQAGVMSYRNLRPELTHNTRLSDLDGAAGNGVRLGAIEINDGTNSYTIDLTGADRISDVLDTINDATAADGIHADLFFGDAIFLTVPMGAGVTVRDIGDGTAAKDLGLLFNPTPASWNQGQSVAPRLTTTTLLTDMADGAGLDLASGLKITNGGASETLAFDTDVTVEDMLNRINNAGLGVRARINADGDGIEIINQINGSELRIGENGGTTADDLGVRTFRPETAMADLRDGRGIRLIDAKTDLRVTARDGATFEVDLSAAVTIDDVITLINDAATAAGVAVAAGFRSIGNGIELTDATGGAGNLSASSINGGAAAKDLGLADSVAGDTLTGDDIQPKSSGGVFTRLAQLRDALLANDVNEITHIAGAIDEAYDKIVGLRARMGGLVQDLETRTDRATDLAIENLSLMSDLKDTDYAEAITQYQALQTALQANLQTGATMLSMSLLDFLR